MKDITIYIKHILESIKTIEHSLEKISKKEFLHNKDKQDANIRRLEIIGEAVKNIPSSFKRKFTEVQWKEIAGTRDVLIHAYFSVDLDLVWDIIKSDLPKLKKNLLHILAQIE